jgi:hypothetical protein
VKTISLQSNSFAKKDDAKIIYKTHCQGLRIAASFNEATMFQQTFLTVMAVDDVSHDLKVETYLKALCESMGVKFK